MNDNGRRLIQGAANDPLLLAAQADARKSQISAALSAEMRDCMRQIYAALAAQHIATELCRDGGPQIDPQKLREWADLSWKAAHYVNVPTGLQTIDDAKLWGGEVAKE